MTVIAWDGETLAADRRASIGTYKRTSMNKLYRVPQGICATAGRADDGLMLIDWVKNNGLKEEFPTSDDRSFVLITNDKKIVVYNDAPIPIEIEAPFFAIGSGGEYATAAMYLGKTAREAVEIACALDSGCGNGIDTMTLQDTLDTPDMPPKVVKLKCLH